jgi:hypothetical protein
MIKKDNSNESHDEPKPDEKQSETFEELSRVLLKTLDSFKPFNLNDNKLKLELLGKILECQKLLFSEESKQHKADASQKSQMYDEWKVLAMVADRICFLIYLFALILTPLMFVLREYPLFYQ